MTWMRNYAESDAQNDSSNNVNISNFAHTTLSHTKHILKSTIQTSQEFSGVYGKHYEWHVKYFNTSKLFSIL